MRDHPGAYVREVMGALGMPQGQVSYHLDTLESRGLVASSKEEYHKRYFVPGTVPREQRGLARFLKAEVPRRVLLALLRQPGTQHGALAEHIGVRASTLTYHMKRLEAQGVVVRERQGGEVRYRVAQPEQLVDAMVTYRTGLMDAAVDRFLASWQEMHPGHLRVEAERAPAAREAGTRTEDREPRPASGERGTRTEDREAGTRKDDSRPPP